MREALRRAIDVAVSGAALAVTSPLLGILALAVRLDSPGPSLFVQTRVGRGGRPIRIVKLRTMTVAGQSARQVTSAGDPRVTRVGAVLRATKLDELPQLWSILRGDMSLVGPRPEVPRYVAQYRPEWRRLLDVRPGLTDLASIAFRHEERVMAGAQDPERAYVSIVMPMKLVLALEGLDRRSLWFDLCLVARTIAAVVCPGEPHPVVREAERQVRAQEHAS